MRRQAQERRLPSRITRPARYAFTLMEVLLVLAILVILGGMAVFAFQDTLFGSNIKSAETQVKMLANPINQFLMDHGRFPENLDELYNPPPIPNSTQEPRRYIDHPVPLDPWGNEYIYRYPAQRSDQRYDLYSLGPDQQDGTADDIGNWSVPR